MSSRETGDPSLQELMAGVVHEIRNPLCAIQATLDAFEARFGAREEFQRYTGVLRSELERLDHLMKDLVDFSEPLSAESALLPIAQVLEEAVVHCTPAAKQRRITIDSEIAPGLPPLTLDRWRAAEAFQKLLENAIQHSPEGGTVRIRARLLLPAGSRPALECRVEDEGAGFPPNDLPRVFDPFFRRRRGGSGLGLAISRRLVEGQGGLITAANRPGGGAAVTVRFPADPPGGPGLEEELR